MTSPTAAATSSLTPPPAAATSALHSLAGCTCAHVSGLPDRAAAVDRHAAPGHAPAGASTHGGCSAGTRRPRDRRSALVGRRSVTLVAPSRR